MPGPLEADGEGAGARAGYHDQGHLDDVGSRPRGEHPQHPGLVPAREERHQPVQVYAAALGQPWHQLPGRADACQALDEEDRELPGQHGRRLVRRRLRAARTGRLVACRGFLVERRPDVRERDELDRGLLLVDRAAGRQG
jgi:hypothetical protein